MVTEGIVRKMKRENNVIDINELPSLSMEIITIENGLRFMRQRAAMFPNQELQWEVRLYEWILAQPEARKKARQYLDLRHKGDVSLSKREVVYELGWVVS